MPQFEMIDSEDTEFLALPKFVQGYIEALFFTESAASCYTMENWNSEETQEAVREGQADGNLPSDAGFSDLHHDSLMAICGQCVAFEFKASKLLEQAYGMEMQIRGGSAPYSETQAGHDFWFTRNGHGVGFWDRGLGQVGDDLAEIARSFGEVNVWFADHVDNGDAPFVYHQ
jgi:hypothetical protein